MLMIRKEQMHILSQNMFKSFIDSMEQHLKVRYPEQTKEMNDYELRELIFDGTEQAEGYDITDENDVKRFLEYLVQYGRDFSKSPETMWAAQFLNNEDLTGTERMNEIDNYDLFVITLGK